MGFLLFFIINLASNLSTHEKNLMLVGTFGPDPFGLPAKLN
jgi:hypothetical protein